MILKIYLLFSIFIYFCIIFNFIKRGRIYLKYALLWIFLGLAFVVFAIFPSTLNSIMYIFGIHNPLNGLFAFLFFFLFIFIICLLTTITRLNDSNRKCIQKIALLEKLVQELALKEKENDEDKEKN